MLHSGSEVTVWNRTAAKAELLSTQAAHPATAPAAAVAASPVTIVCVDDYAATRAVLGQEAVVAVLEGKTIVQFSTGTPAEARDGARWAKGHGAVFVSGDAALFEEHQPLLSGLTNELRYRGPAVGAAAALDLAVLSYYIGAHLGLVHGALICESEQVGAESLTSVIADSLPSDVTEIAHMGEALARNDFSQPAASLAVYSGILDRLLAQARSSVSTPRFRNSPTAW